VENAYKPSMILKIRSSSDRSRDSRQKQSANERHWPRGQSIGDKSRLRSLRLKNANEEIGELNVFSKLLKGSSQLRHSRVDFLGFRC
jgi:hypothetical protein